MRMKRKGERANGRAGECPCAGSPILRFFNSPVRPFAHSPFRKKAFTLLELILAMMITCLLAAALYGSLWTAFKARDSAVAAVTPVRKLQIAMALIGNGLQCALPMNDNSNNPNSLIGPFEGQPQGAVSQLSPTIEFYAIKSGVDSNDPTQADGVKRIDIQLATLDDGSQALVRNVTPALPGDQQSLVQGQTQATPVQEILCRDVAGFTVQYYDGQNWYDTWDATAYSNALPMAVQIMIQLKAPPGKDPDQGMELTRTFALPAAVPINSSSSGGT